MELHPVGATLFNAKRQRETTKLIIALHNFANASSNSINFAYYEEKLLNRISLNIILFCKSTFKLTFPLLEYYST